MSWDSCQTAEVIQTTQIIAWDRKTMMYPFCDLQQTYKMYNSFIQHQFRVTAYAVWGEISATTGSVLLSAYVSLLVSGSYTCIPD